MVTITYETLFEVLRKEKNQEDLQKLDESFFEELKKYIDDKTSSLYEKVRLDEFVEGYENEQNAVKIQLQNIRKLVRDIFDRRERKIMDMAINKAKTGSNIIDTSALLPDEKKFFNAQIKLISEFRFDILENVLSSQKTASRALEQARNAQSNYGSLGPAGSAWEPKELNMAPSEEINKDLKKVQILESVPKFVGVDLEIYGPFSSDEEVDLRPEIAEMLVKTSKARVLN